MNNEIKEILDKLKKKEEIYLFQIINGFSFNSDEYEAHLLLDYITNLQEENKRLVELCDKYEEEHKTTFKIWKKDLKNFEHEKNRELKSRIDKAIEYIENNYQYGNDISCYEEVELLDILKGENNE